MEEQGFFYRDTWAEVDLDRIKANVKAIREHLPEDVEFIAVVKANAYGHGDSQTAEAALEAGASMLAVAFMDEALALRKKGISAPILVLGASRAEDVNIAAEEGIILTVFQEEWLAKACDVLSKDASISLHIKIDTGMGRIGIRSADELKSIEKLIKEDSRLELHGIYTHFATADEMDDTYFKRQLSKFKDMLTTLDKQPPVVHSSNSAAALMHADARFNAVRVGIAMYGLAPSMEIAPELPVELQEAFSLHSRLVHVKKLEKGEKVSYGATYEAAEDIWVGTLPIGYADGWIRRLQGQEVLVDGKRSPIIGRICMDQCMVKLPYEVRAGEIATLIGEQGEETISINEIANKLETINYEVPCIISSRVPRLYKQDGKVVELNNSLL
ncbi:alanine racemase [Mesobacillus subterraneus]|uniref:alanine racemase n=1 Tax=Mesobacillus subterraneus TaxID=285983 RepID=UPI00203A8F7D|nr:alanine racemase [Mesobacillus subterraneus]MCM3685666.1 alanine racemase [Mesobacillus subterraneus]